jgi:hypothetical protein
MSRHKVGVTGTWRSREIFEFETEEEALQFADKVNEGDLEALVNEGDIDSANAELVDYDAHIIREKK